MRLVRLDQSLCKLVSQFVKLVKLGMLVKIVELVK